MHTSAITANTGRTREFIRTKNDFITAVIYMINNPMTGAEDTRGLIRLMINAASMEH